MKIKLMSLLLVITLAVLTIPQESQASYLSEDDITLSINLAEDLIQPSGSLGTTSFETQEEIHSTITNVSGAEVDHSYIWIELNGVKILAVDPIKVVY
ncbi:hypothetical protein [Litchfieldia salsa]|uniref:Uncharacterized protein n=1 Tax=Litchfieldia salsa TaxID=930152 RepID=A0A1H0PPS7_9BACI|nr:hypothetical protein [Litchfieldia salsa]SDP07063.1 hypothetical protein SAMN05216565_101415 [Litchfieldia salsa]